MTTILNANRHEKLEMKRNEKRGLTKLNR